MVMFGCCACVGFCVDLSLSPWWVPGGAIAGSWGDHDCFLRTLPHFIVHLHVGVPISAPPPTVVPVSSVGPAIWVDVECVPLVLVCICLLADHVYISSWLIANCLSVENAVLILWPFSNWGVCLLLLNRKSSLHIWTQVPGTCAALAYPPARLRRCPLIP